MLSATAAAVADGGLESVTVTRIVSLAGVSRRTFYNLFEDRADCLLATIEQSVEDAGERARRAYETREAWVDRIRAGLFALLEYFEQEPQVARLCIVRCAVTDPAMVSHRQEVLERLASVIDAGCEEGRQPPSPLTAEGLVGGALDVVHTRLLNPRSEKLTDLRNPLMSFIVLPYLGPLAARMELQRPLPAASAPQKSSNTGEKLSDLELRMTYRTMRVLAAIAADPGLSNAQTSEHAGVSDQGQISKLLRRLQRLGLIENSGEGQARGGANAWRLTRRGQQLESSIDRELLDTWR